MYLIIRFFTLFSMLIAVFAVRAQEQMISPKVNFKTLEVGGFFANAEATYYGFYSKFKIPLSQSKHHFAAGFSFTSYFDFSGESEPNAELEKDVDARFIPAVFAAWQFNFKKINLSIEAPIGTSIALTKGNLVNKNIGFERSYSNTEILLHFGLASSLTYQINKKNKIGLYGFYPLVKDIAWTLPGIGIGWTIAFYPPN